MYEFVYVSLDKVPTIKDWKLRITKDSLIGNTGIPKSDSILTESNDKVADSYARFYFGEPHINIESSRFKNKDGSFKEHVTTEALFFSLAAHPLNLIPQRNEGIVKALMRGDDVYINRNGGWSIDTGYTVLDVIKSDKMVFPKDDAIEERITISRYPASEHYYLSSNMKCRIFANNAFSSQKEAIEEAKKYVKEDKITVKSDTFAYRYSGD